MPLAPLLALPLPMPLVLPAAPTLRCGPLLMLLPTRAAEAPVAAADAAPRRSHRLLGQVEDRAGPCCSGPRKAPFCIVTPKWLAFWPGPSPTLARCRLGLPGHPGGSPEAKYTTPARFLNGRRADLWPDEGRGPPLVLIHANFGSLSWDGWWIQG
jgi:hypothetical protein